MADPEELVGGGGWGGKSKVTIGFLTYMFGYKGGQGVQTPLENHENIGFLINIGPDSLKIVKLPCPQSILCHDRHASETPFKWHFAGGPIMAR